MKKAIFAGSFNPWHAGHAYILKQSLKQFDQVFVVVAINWQKRNQASLEQRFQQVSRLLKDHPKVKVLKLEAGLVALLARKLGVHYLVRGVRNQVDQAYEDHIAQVNRKYNQSLQTVYFKPLVEHQNISSSNLRLK